MSESQVAPSSLPAPVLHLVCGKVASGKSTLAKRLANQPYTVLISEDAWLQKLYPGEINTLTDYVRRSAQWREALAPHVEALLQKGLSVVLDMPANTVSNREWMRQRIDHSGVAHQLHYLEASNEVCKARLRARNAKGTHPFKVSEEEFEHLTRYFSPPSAEENFNIVLHQAQD